MQSQSSINAAIISLQSEIAIQLYRVDSTVPPVDSTVGGARTAMKIHFGV